MVKTDGRRYRRRHRLTGERARNVGRWLGNELECKTNMGLKPKDGLTWAKKTKRADNRPKTKNGLTTSHKTKRGPTKGQSANNGPNTKKGADMDLKHQKQ
jgi:hypothetical protein